MMNNVTLTQYLVEQQRQNNIPDDHLRLLLDTLASACTRLAHLVSQGQLANILGSQDTENIQGEVQKKLDVISNDMLLEANQWGGYLSAMASEELEHIQPVPSQYPKGPYLLLFDPLDGSSNIDVNVSIGTIFSVLKAPNGNSTVTEQDFLQAGVNQMAAGYVVYGPQTLLVLTLGNGVVGFTLNKDTGTWLLTHPNMQVPADTAEFAINMSNMRHWHEPVKQYIQDCLTGESGPLAKNYNMRWIASMVADVHRVLTRGGVFMYPNDTRPSVTNGKLRLMYEANPMSFIVEQAGGAATTGTDRILEINPTGLHQRTSVILGSKNEIKRIQKYFTT